MNISAFNPQLDSTSGAWISSVSERLLKEIKNCLAHTNDSQQTQAKSYSIVFSAFFFWKENLNFFYFYVFFLFVLQQSFMYKLLLRKHVSSWSPDGIAQQCQDKQVPVLRLFSVSVSFGTELHIPLPSCRVHGKYTIHVFTQHIKLNTLQWQELKGKKWTIGVLFCSLSCIYLIPDLSKGITSDLR